MRQKMFTKALLAITAAAMVMSAQAVMADEEDYTVITDENGDPIDLGGMDIVIRDWWSGDPAEPTNDYEEARDEYREWIQETYNFTISQKAISDWTSTPADFVDYATTGGDENYIWILRDDPAITSALSSGLMYDLATLDCLDFSLPKFQRNKLHEQYAKGDSIYAMYAGYSEPRTGVYFNKRLLNDAGIDPETIYMTTIAVFSNNGSYIGKNDDGYFYNLESPETLEALEWTVDMFTKYDLPDPEGAEWDYYKEAFINGQAAFMVEDEYAGTPGNFLQDMEDEVGFVMFPKGPQRDDYINVWSNNPVAIPTCYDADKAWKLAFAWNLYTDQPAGYEDYMDLSNAAAGIFDMRAIDETIPMMMEEEHGTIAYHGLIPNLSLGEQFVWNIAPGSVVSEQVEAIRDTWKAYVDEANK